jgi:hypothetical protein
VESALAQKSIKWIWSFAPVVTDLTEHETKHKRGRDTRFVRGTLNKLVAIRKASRRKFVIFFSRGGIVQPGLLSQVSTYALRRT